MYKIGDIIPLDGPLDDIQRTALRYANNRRGSLQRAVDRLERRGAKNQFELEARKIHQGLAEREHRYTDPFERARMFLQRKGYNVFVAHVVDPEAAVDHYYVGSVRMLRPDLIAKAKSLGFTEETTKENGNGASREA